MLLVYRAFHRFELLCDLPHLYLHGPFSEKDGQIILEAEVALAESPNATVINSVDHKWEKAVGQYYGAMKVTPDNGSAWTDTANLKGNSPELFYTIDFTTTGTYNVWMLYKATNANDDSVHVGLNDEFKFSNIALTRSENFTWSNVGTLTINSIGEHNINIWAREDGLTVDKILLTKSTLSQGDVVANADLDALEISAIRISVLKNLKNNQCNSS